jgi:RNase H-fold protein (predicted Holliday junction resolvase)
MIGIDIDRRKVGIGGCEQVSVIATPTSTWSRIHATSRLP